LGKNKENDMRNLTKFFFLNCIFMFVLLASCSNQIKNDSVSTLQDSKTPNSHYIVNFPVMAGDVPNVTFELAVPKLVWPDGLNIYKNNRQIDINREYLLTMGTKFGMNGDVLEGNDLFTLVDNSTDASLEVYKSTGTFNYIIDSKLFPKEKPVLPSNEEAKNIAMDFLAKRGLLPEGDVASTVDESASSSYGTAHLLVHFTHAIDILGPGTKRGVRIGNEGEVIAVFVNPTNPSNMSVQEVAPAKDMNTAYQEMQTLKKFSMPLATQKVKITDVKTLYWLEPITKYQEYVVPIYGFVGEAFDYSGKQIGGFMGYAHAVN
jgi:hypothetical protein